MPFRYRLQKILDFRIRKKEEQLLVVQKAQQEVYIAEENIRKNTFTFDDFLIQFEQIKKMGNLTDLISMIPGVAGKVKATDIDEKKLVKFKAIIQSMTKEERQNPDLIKASQKKRIAQGSASTIQEVNQLMKQFEQTKQMIKNLSGRNMQKMFGRKINFQA